MRKCAAVLGGFPAVLEMGSRNVNGSARGLFGGRASRYVGIDLTPGPGVDAVADAAVYQDAAGFDLVVCNEVLEHAASARAICRNAYDLLHDRGVLLVTAAGEGRLPHGAGGEELNVGEFYRNVTEAELREWLALFTVVLVDVSQPTDIYALAIK